MTEDLLRSLHAAKEVVVILAALAGAIVAGLGLKKWRQELRGRTEFDVAPRVLVAAYRVMDGRKPQRVDAN